VHLNLIDLYQTPISQTLKGAQDAEHKVNEAIGKLESYYDSQLNLKDE
jgi:DNA integrity scanning protein DisA with diadenylate cyclase activity